MINQAPDNWEYSDDLEMLFLFYQCTDELLSETSPDSYALPLHNSLTLLIEMAEVYNLIERYSVVDEYYKRYLPLIIDEFISHTENDYILKRMLGIRLQSIRTGLREAKEQPSHLGTWVHYVMQTCSPKEYLDLYKEEIIRLVTSTVDKRKLMYCVCNYFIMLRWLGYSREYLYISAKKFFSNQNRIINNCNQIQEYLDTFSTKRKRFDFLMLLDIDSIEYMDSISDSLIVGKQIEKVDVTKELAQLQKDQAVSELIKEYQARLHQAGAHTKMAIVRFYDDDFDAYSAAKSFTEYISFLQSFARYFKHFNYTKQVYKILQDLGNGHYRELKIPNELQKRPYVEQSVIDSRIRNIINSESMASAAFTSITQAIEMHAEAFDTRNTPALLRTFWTALETLFASPYPGRTRDNVINSVLPIIQKTYILKRLRSVYMQLVEATRPQDRKSLNIDEFISFLEFFSAHDTKSAEMKKVFGLLSRNPLLRTRLFDLRNTLDNGKSIKEMVDNHKAKIEWQLARLYRIRNISTHLGEMVTGTEVAVNHLHNYFDYVVNFILCKSENGDYVFSTSSVVFEAKNDNKIYEEILKKNEKLSSSNYVELLFGPDKNLVNYRFEY